MGVLRRWILVRLPGGMGKVKGGVMDTRREWNLGQVGIISPEVTGMRIPSQNFFLIRFYKNKEEWSAAFKVLMKSNVGKEIIIKLKTGKRIPIIPKKMFTYIKVPEITASIKKSTRSIINKEKTAREKIEKIVRDTQELYAGYLKQES